ncbi:hypothetical protein CBW65_12615 [Tumebacillus avium]|uniref:Uncharacterized protein n=1 Tax=Tumebacillus avium TaxID=1903704 RepID=A0A1Y0IQQ3_9BACL|nr:hypothetical protein [Tumebacillus avium]ARU61775.1 hypothetical protein CBW65_12615 [Tumebacillus avium]
MSTSQVSKQRKAELVDYVEQMLNRSNTLQSASNPSNKITRSVWDHITQLLRIVETSFSEETDRKKQFNQWIHDLPSRAKDIKVNAADLKKVQTFLLHPKFQSFGTDEMRYVLGWLQRLS